MGVEGDVAEDQNLREDAAEGVVAAVVDVAQVECETRL